MESGGTSLARWGYLKTVLATTKVELKPFGEPRQMLENMEDQSNE